MQIIKQIILSSMMSALIVLGILAIAGERFLPQPSTAAPVAMPEKLAEVSSPEAIPDVIDRVNDAVVSVVATKDVPVYERYFEEYNPFGDWFGGFSIPRVRENGTEEQEVGGGTGFVVSADGLIVTNRHVVADDEASYSVMFQNGQVYDVAVKAKDPVLDIAILEITNRPETPLPYLTFGDSSAVRLGESVIAIGNALAEFDNSVSVGIISGRGRSITARDGMGQTEELSNVFQTDAAINPGNSGGPLLNLDGEVIGVNVAASLGAENIGFAIPSEAVVQVVDSVVTYGEIRRPFLGVRYTMISERIQRANNLSVDYGALIARGETREELAVMPGSPADKAGLRENDIILAIDGVKLDETDLANVLRTKAVDATITLRILRQGNEEEVVVTLAPAPTN
jgi:serine protease Do